MLDEKKVRLMTKMSIYEKRDGKHDIKLAKYFKSDYVHYQLLRVIVAVTFGYLMLLFLAAIYKSDYLIAEAVTLDYAAIGKKILIIYVGLIVGFGFLAVIGYSIAYTVSRKRLSNYYNLLKKLKKIYVEENTSAGETVEAEGRNEK